MDEKLRILLCEDDENLGMLLREYFLLAGNTRHYQHYTAYSCSNYA